MPAYYNENDPKAAAWLRELIYEGHIADGVVDERSIEDLTPDDLKGYKQAHFFAGIGGWSYGLRLAGWPDDREVWTGSCPCQPFSAAGRGLGVDDDRHLWPVWFALIRECRPAVIFGEQVASADAIGKRREVSKKISAKAPRQGFNPARETPIKSEEFAVRFRPIRIGDTNPNRCRPVRDYWGGVFADGRTHVGQPFIGSGRPESRLHLLKHSGGGSRDELHDGRLGRGNSFKVGASSYETAAERFQRVFSKAVGESQEADGNSWISIVQSDLERIDYTFGACDTPAAGVGAPHIRQRLYFVAYHHQRREVLGSAGLLDGVGTAQWDDLDRCSPDVLAQSPGEQRHGHGHGYEGRRRQEPANDSGFGDVGVAHVAGPQGRRFDWDCGDERPLGSPSVDGLEHPARDGRIERRPASGERRVERGCGEDELADPYGWDASAERESRSGEQRLIAQDGRVGESPAQASFWSAHRDIPCTDGKSRPGPIEPKFQPLAHGLPHRVGLLRGYGNAIVPQVAQAFIESYLEVTRSSQ